MSAISGGLQQSTLFVVAIASAAIVTILRLLVVNT